jgi:PAS domain S-box-containing protein
LNQGDDLRRMAEERLKGDRSDQVGSTAEEGRDALALVHELQVHQIELEMQNEELKRAKLEAEDALAKYSDLYDFAPIGLFTFDEKGQIQEVNLAGAALLGVERRNLMNRSFLKFVAPRDRASFNDFCKKAFETCVKQTCEMKLLRDGEPEIYAHIEGMATEEFESNGRMCRIAVMDITDSRKAGEALSQAKDELELRVQERTADLEKSNRDLLEAKEAAEAASKVKSDFMANMSHEMRTPMNAVIGMTSILLDEPLTSEQKEYMEIIRHSGNALLVVINDILDFSRLDKEKAELEVQLFDLRALVEESLDQVALEAAEKNLNLAYIMAKEVPETIYSDPARLRQVLHNLLNNAVKFTEKGEILVSVGRAPAGIRQEIRFAIQDTGIGISQEHLKKIFLPFTQVDPSLSRNYEGLGLGLAISKRLVELMGGKIQVRSEPRKGSCFLFTIRAKVLPEEPRKVPSGVQAPLKGKRVLIVADSKTNRMILGKLIYEWGMMPLPISSANEALGHLKRDEEFDAIILGTDLAEEGILLAEKIHETDKELPIILLAPVGMKTTEHFAAILFLPIKPLQLYNILIRIFTLTPAQKIACGDVLGEASPLRILLAEDNVNSQRVTLQMLKKLGYRADVAANGLEVIQALKRQHYDLVLMDVKMPLVDGLEATRKIRRLWPENEPKIIALTAYALAGDREKCLAAGMDGYLAKPVTLEDLGQTLEDMRTK